MEVYGVTGGLCGDMDVRGYMGYRFWSCENLASTIIRNLCIISVYISLFMFFFI